MIGFFRRIRKKLADDNKPMKYMRYAIGEVLLVMVGILLALQVNNWNEQRKAVQIQLQLVKELQQSAKEDYTRNQFQFKENQKSLNSLKIILNQLENNLPYSDSLAYHFSKAHGRFVAQIKDNAYKNVKEYGLNFIHNDTTKVRMTNLYENRNEYLEKLDERFNLFYYQVAAPELILCFDHIPPQGSMRNNMVPLDYISLSKNMKYMNILRSTYSYMEQYLEWQENIILNGLNDLSQRLDSEIMTIDNSN